MDGKAADMPLRDARGIVACADGMETSSAGKADVNPTARNACPVCSFVQRAPVILDESIFDFTIELTYGHDARNR